MVLIVMTSNADTSILAEFSRAKTFAVKFQTFGFPAMAWGHSGFFFASARTLKIAFIVIVFSWGCSRGNHILIEVGRFLRWSVKIEDLVVVFEIWYFVVLIKFPTGWGFEQVIISSQLIFYVYVYVDDSILVVHISITVPIIPIYGRLRNFHFWFDYGICKFLVEKLLKYLMFLRCKRSQRLNRRHSLEKIEISRRLSDWI